MFQPDVPLGLEPYLPIAVVAALDAVFGALRAYLDGIFDDKVFVVSFISNVVIASGIVYLGDRLGVGGQLSTGVIVVLGIRIFTNVAAIRRRSDDRMTTWCEPRWMRFGRCSASTARRCSLASIAGNARAPSTKSDICRGWPRSTRPPGRRSG